MRFASIKPGKMYPTTGKRKIFKCGGGGINLKEN